MKTMTMKAICFGAALMLTAAFSTSAQAQNDHLKCFKVKDGKTFKKATADIEVTTGHLAGLQNCQITAGAKEFCVPVTKSNVVIEDGTETPVAGETHSFDRLCYKVKCPVTTPGPKTYMDQFGSRVIDGFKVATICTPTVIGPPPEEPPPSWPATPQDYVAGPSSYVNSLTIPEVLSGVPTCCKDFGAISRDKIENNTNNVDNALAVLADTLGGFGINFQTTLDESIQDGSLVILLDHPGLNVLSIPDQFALVQFIGSFEGATNFTAADAGLGTFLISQDSFVGGTGEPLNWYHPALMDTSTMNAGPFTLSLALPFGLLSIDVSAEQASAEADHGAATLAGVPYSNGELAGYILIDDIFDNLNVILNSPTCACLSLTQDVYFKDVNDVWDSNCVANPENVCTLPEEEVCVTLAGSNLFGSPPQVCGALPGILQGQADIDLNSNSDIYEGLSVGLQFTGVNAQIVGVEP